MKCMGTQMNEIAKPSEWRYAHGVVALEQNPHLEIVEVFAPSALRYALLSEMKSGGMDTRQIMTRGNDRLGEIWVKPR